MLPWELGMASNAVIAVAYVCISMAIVVPLARSNQLRSNPLGGATAGIFFTCAVHHGTHAVHMLMPSLGVDDARGIAMRAAWSWPLSVWDLVSAFVALYYWSLRRNYGKLMQGAKLFEDMRQREQQALELNDSVLQGIVVAKMALEMEEPAKAEAALSTSINAASRIITDLLGNKDFDIALLRSSPAVVEMGRSVGLSTGPATSVVGASEPGSTTSVPDRSSE